MRLDDQALDRLFRTARTRWEFTDEPVTDEDLRELYDLVKLGPTSANSSPARFMFVRSAEGKEKLKPALSAGNLDKTMKAPVTVIVAQDPQFYHQLPRLYPPVTRNHGSPAILIWRRTRRTATRCCRAAI